MSDLQKISRTLCKIVRQGEVTIVQNFLKIEEHLQVLVNDANAPLRFAALSGHLDIVDELLHFEIVKMHITASENGALRYAALNGHVHVVKRLLDFDEVVKKVNAFKNGALSAAAQNGHLDVVELLLSVPEVYNNVSGFDNHVIHTALIMNQVPVAERLFKIEQVAYIARILIDQNHENARLLKILFHPVVKAIRENSDDFVVTELDAEEFVYAFKLALINENYITASVLVQKMSFVELTKLIKRGSFCYYELMVIQDALSKRMEINQNNLSKLLDLSSEEGLNATNTDELFVALDCQMMLEYMITNEAQMPDPSDDEYIDGVLPSLNFSFSSSSDIRYSSSENDNLDSNKRPRLD